MPTTRQRHFVTETDELQAALDAAARRWPELTRPQLLVRLALAGERAVEAAAGAERQRRVEAIHAFSGALTEAYEPGYLEALREDWPE